MGMHGCGWVGCGPGGTGDIKTRQEGLIYALAGPDLGPMAGEISPDIMFCEKTKKHEYTTPYGCTWVSMSAYALTHAVASKNTTKRGGNDLSGHVLSCMVDSNNKQELGDETIWGREGYIWVHMDADGFGCV